MSDDDIGSMYRMLNEVRRVEGEDRRSFNSRKYHAAAAKAQDYGLKLLQHSDVHYTLTLDKAGKKSTWLLNIYPGNQRLYWDRQYLKPPWLSISDMRDWTLFDVVDAAIFACGLKPKTPVAIPVSDNDIRVRAYYLWLDAGCPEGTGEDFWLKAEKLSRR